MSDDSLTDGARRALDGASFLALRGRSPERGPIHLLGALFLQETRAAEILRSAGVTPEAIDEKISLSLELDRHERRLILDADLSDLECPDSAALRRVLSHAIQAALGRGRHVEVGTEQLLVSLMSVEPAIGRAFTELGFGIETLAASIAGDRPEDSGEPIEIDFHIDWTQQSEADKTRALRVLDAAANRAREGLRVLEDYARFVLDDAHLSRRLKEYRHALREALEPFASTDLLRSRETLSDVGTRNSTPAESVRQSPADVAHAAFKRVEEAIRSLEEFSKLSSPQGASEFERLRYELYTLEKALLLTEFSRRRFAARRLYLLVTESLCHHGSGPAVREALAGGVDVVQLREKEFTNRKIIERAGRVREWTREAGALFIMNDRPDLAVLTQADGVHVGQDDLSVKDARAIVGPHRLVGVSTHTIEQARQAVLDGADYIGVGPVFPSATKSFESLAGLELVRQVAAEITLPWFAIGGITAQNIDQVLDTGATRVAVSSAICGAERPRDAAKELAERLATSDSTKNSLPR